MRAAWCQGQSQFAGYYCYRGEPVVRLAGEAPFRYAGHAQVVNGEQAAAQLIIFREARQGRLRHGAAGGPADVQLCVRACGG